VRALPSKLRTTILTKGVLIPTAFSRQVRLVGRG
jgi:hypothetical protein